MNNNFFGFQDMPFSLNVNSNTDFVYPSQNYAMALPILVSSLDRNNTFTLILGENGVGKTTFINYVCNQLQQQDYNVRLLTARLDSAQDLFQQVLTSFDQEIDNTGDNELLLQLSFFLATRIKEPDRLPAILIIDDADSIALGALKGIELLLGLNIGNKPVLQIILVGQPSLKKLNNVSGLQGLLQNTTTECLLEPLSQKETQHYINHKINLVCAQDRKLFNEQTNSVIYEYSKGIPALIDWICDKALVRSSELQKHEVSSELIREIIYEHTGVSEKRNPWVFSSALTIVVVGFFFALFFVPNFFISLSKDPKTEQSNKLEEIPVKDKSTVQIADLVKTHHQEENQNDPEKKNVLIEENQQNKILKKEIIETLLATAERQFANSKFSTPKTDNATETYIAILKVAPEEQRAKEGMQRIVKHYLDQAKKRYSNGSLNKSQRLISRGLKVSPDNKELIKLKRQIGVELKKVERQNKINALFKQAKQQIDTLQLTKPLNDNAYKTYQDIAALDKNNIQAKDGILNLLARLESQVQKLLDKKNYTEALKATKEIIKLSSKGIRDPFHKEAIFAASETRKIIDEQLKNLLSLAEKQQKMQQLTQPSGDNALLSYKKALQLDPYNKDANKGLDKLEKQYHELVKIALSEGKTDHAIESANEGLKAFPDDRELLSLRSSAILQQEIDINKVEDFDNEKKSEEIEQEIKNFGTF